jgi:hypothetical protein
MHKLIHANLQVAEKGVNASTGFVFVFNKLFMIISKSIFGWGIL